MICINASISRISQVAGVKGDDSVASGAHVVDEAVFDVAVAELQLRFAKGHTSRTPIAAHCASIEIEIGSLYSPNPKSMEAVNGAVQQAGFR